jgi:hypothetical protein
VNRASTVLLVFLAFGSGLGSGAIIARSRLGHGGGDIPTRFDVLDAMASEVGLSSEQKAKCLAIQERHHPRVSALKASIANDLAAIRSDARAEMRSVCDTPEQRERFERFCARRDAQRAAAEK